MPEAHTQKHPLPSQSCSLGTPSRPRHASAANAMAQTLHASSVVCEGSSLATLPAGSCASSMPTPRAAAAATRCACLSESCWQGIAVSCFDGDRPPPKKRTLRATLTATWALPGTKRPWSWITGPIQLIALGSKVAKSARSMPPRGTSPPVPPPKTSTLAFVAGSSSSGMRTAECEFRGGGAFGSSPMMLQVNVDKSNTSMVLLAHRSTFPPNSIT
mmetsp:Transcript_16587/g.46202  ORF Transcript_16587/g.46202 Transcript_16587/m.46202 type:complete len:216 (+) Transcript_16587:201-848(+)